jgi:glycosyltransferase involved in cell wall biosynthesis
VDALLFRPDDPQDLARCLLSLLDDANLAGRLSASAAARARTDFTWQAAQDRLLEVYQKVLIGTPPD